MSKFVVLFGPPGCGKGTQAARLKEALGVPHISTGDMFRDHLARETELGGRVKAIMSTGELVPDSITDEMVRERLGREDAAQGVLLDGYPRNVHQAAELERILGALGKRVEAVLVIEVPDAELKRRLLERGEKSGRADDQDLDTIRTRLGVYVEESAPCIAYYREQGVCVHPIDGVGSMDEVTERILSALR